MAITLVDIAQRSESNLISGIVKTIIERSPFLSIIPFRTAPSKRLTIARESELPAGNFRSGSSAYTAAKAATNRTEIQLKIFGGSFDIDATDIDIPTFDAKSELAYQIDALSRGLGLDMKAAMIDGDEAVDIRSFTGIKAWHQLFRDDSIANTTLLNGAANGTKISTAGSKALLNGINGAINQCITIPTIGITNRAVISAMEAETVSATNSVFAQYFKPEIVTLNGVRVQGGVYKGIQIVAIDEDSQGNQLLGFDQTVGASNVTASIYFIALGQGLSMGVNQYPEGLRMRRVEKDAGITITIDWPAGFIAEHPKAISRLEGILAE